MVTAIPEFPPYVVSLLLHDVTDKPLSSGFRQPTAQKYKHSVTQFRSYLDVVEHSGIAVSETLSKQLPQKSLQFTFDDGGASAMSAADLLEERGWRGFFFVTTDLIGKNGFLTQPHIADLHSRGHVIGSHSCSHPDVFRDLSKGAMRREWSESRDVLQQLLGTEIVTVSVPGGDIDSNTIAEAAASGYQHVFTSEQLTRPWIQASVRCYGRLMMLQQTSPETLRRWLTYPAVGVIPERALRFGKKSVKRLIAPVYRRIVQRRRAMHES